MDESRTGLPDEPLAFTVDQFCATTGIRRSRIYGALKEGQLRAGKRILIPRQAAEAWLRQLEAV